MRSLSGSGVGYDQAASSIRSSPTTAEVRGRTLVGAVGHGVRGRHEIQAHVDAHVPAGRQPGLEQCVGPGRGQLDVTGADHDLAGCRQDVDAGVGLRGG